MRKNKIESRSVMRSPGWATALIRKAIEKHDSALLAKTPRRLRGRSLRQIVRQLDTKTRRVRGTTRWARSFARKAMEEHRTALSAESPIRLRIRRFSEFMWQIEIK